MPILPEGIVEPVIEAETVPCQILESADVQGKSGVELHTLLSRPTIIRGLIDHWPAHERFGSDATGLQSPGLDAFAAAFGNHTLLAKRANFARQACERAGADDWATLVPFTDVFPHIEYEHVVVYNGDVGMHRSECVHSSPPHFTACHACPPPRAHYGP